MLRRMTSIVYDDSGLGVRAMTMLGAVLAALSIGHAVIGCIVEDVSSVSLHFFGCTNTKNCMVYCFPVREEVSISS